MQPNSSGSSENFPLFSATSRVTTILWLINKLPGVVHDLIIVVGECPLSYWRTQLSYRRTPPSLVKSSEWVSFPKLLKFRETQLSRWQSPWSYWRTFPELLENVNSLELVVGELFVRCHQNLSWLTTNFNCVRILLSFRRTPLTRW